MSNDDMDGKPPQKGGTPSSGGPGRQMLVWMAVILGVVLIFAMANYNTLSGKVKTITYDAFMRQVEGKNSSMKIESVSIDNKTGIINGKYSSSGMPASEPDRFTVQGPPSTTNDMKFNNWLEENGIKVDYKAPSALWESILYILPVLVLGLLFYMLIARQMRGSGGNPFNFGKSRAVRIEKDKNRKTFDDVAGVDEAREEVKEIVDFLRSPEKAERLGGRLPRGVLLVGPPGTGKTLLAKAIAGEAEVPFFSISGSDFVEMFVGVGASRVRDLFEQAKASSPCIIFLDEIDAVGRKRANEQLGSGQEAAQTLNAILVEMDGFTSDDKVIVIAATNRADVLDPALLRPGRFDRQINVDLPDIKGREAILKVHVKTVKLGEDVDLSIIARATPSFSGAELANIVNEAALLAAFTDKENVDMSCFEEARDKVRFGKEKKTRVMRDEDRRDTAFHEAGHALLMKLLPHVTPLHKVSIIPRGRALGLTMQLPERDEYSMSRRKLEGQVVVCLGGRAAEELFLDDISNGASNDILQATAYVKAMICEWGMSKELGLVNYSERFMAKSGSLVDGREFSENTAQKIDEEVRVFINNCYEQACKVLREHEDDTRLVVDALMEFEVLSREEFDLLLESRSLDKVREYRKSPRKAFEALKKTIDSEKVESDSVEISSEAAEAAAEKKSAPAATEESAESENVTGDPHDTDREK